MCVFLPLVLEFLQIDVPPVAGRRRVQFGMRADGGNRAVLHIDDLVRIRHGGNAVRDHQRRAPRTAGDKVCKTLIPLEFQEGNSVRTLEENR